MFLRDDEIYIGGISVQNLVEQFGTPLYVYEAEKIVKNYNRVVSTARKYYNNFNCFYAIKACNNLNIAELLTSLGAGIDAASVNEINLAKALGVDGSKIMFSGNYLSDEDLEEALTTGAIINLDDESLLPRLLMFGTPEILSFRVDPGWGFSNLGHYVTNAGPEAKFGVHKEHAVEAYQEAKDSGIKRFGVHMMPGSCVLDVDYFKKVTEMLLDIVVRIVQDVKIDIEFIDLGGGLGIPYKPDETYLDLDNTFSKISKLVKTFCEKSKISNPQLLMEPARYFVGNAGYLIGRVHTIKNSYKTIIGTDISMNVLARPAMYNAYHNILVNGKESHPREELGLCGQICENTDFWCKDRLLPESIEVGDTIVVTDAGAYGYAMSYQYNGRLRPAEVLIDKNGPRLIRRRESFHDITHNMILPPGILKRVKDMHER